MSHLNPVAQSYYPTLPKASSQGYQYHQPFQVHPTSTLQSGYENSIVSQSTPYLYELSPQTCTQTYVQQSYASPHPVECYTNYQHEFEQYGESTNSASQQTNLSNSPAESRQITASLPVDKVIPEQHQSNSNFYRKSHAPSLIAQIEHHPTQQMMSSPATVVGPSTKNSCSHESSYQHGIDINGNQDYSATYLLNSTTLSKQNTYQSSQKSHYSNSEQCESPYENQYSQMPHFQPHGNQRSPLQHREYEQSQETHYANSKQNQLNDTHGSHYPHQNSYQQPHENSYSTSRQAQYEEPQNNDYHQSRDDRHHHSRRDQYSHLQQDRYGKSLSIKEDKLYNSQDHKYQEPFPNKNDHRISQSPKSKFISEKQGNNLREVFRVSSDSKILHRGSSESFSDKLELDVKNYFQSPLNDFGDMGAAVQRYAASVPKKMKSNASEFPGTNATTLDHNEYRQSHDLSVWDGNDGGFVPDPFEHFEDFPGLKDVQISAFYEAGFKVPMPIQAQTWPIALKESDLVSIAKTGSGKTLAYLLPAYRKIDLKFSGLHRAIHMLVLAPTRELAVQIQTEADKFGSIIGHHTACAYGGAPKGEQLKAINSGASVLIATPGRLNDFLDSRQVNLSSVFYLVLDEADRMLDMGFEPQIRSILRHLPRKRQTLMFSATWPEEVRLLANDFLHNPVHIRLGNQETLQANENIRQYLLLLNSSEHKDDELVKLLRKKSLKQGDLVLVFVARKNTCEFVANLLNRVGIRAAAMHGDRTQEYREKTLATFKHGSLPVLVATDVASRGLDVKGLIAVVNYDLPGSTEDYVHRIGRTGRAGLTGESYTFLSHSHEDTWKALGIVEVMEKTGQEIPHDVQQAINQLKNRQQQNIERRAAEDEQFSKVLIVAEKPSVAKMIAENLSFNGRFRTRRGKSRANQIFELIKWFEPAKRKCKIMITSVVGHIFGLSFEDGRCKDLATMFDAPVKKVIEDNTKKLCIVEHLQELGNESEFLFLWLDCDREGENIGFEVISLTQNSIHYDNVYRARFSSLTKLELQYAFNNPERPDKYSAMSVDARQELDLKIGVAFTRLMTRTYLEQARTKFRLKDQKCVSYGPCQTPTLWFCVQRHKEIQAFRREKYFTMSVDINIEGRNCKFQYIDEKINDLDQVKRIEKALLSTKHAVVADVIEAKKKSPKPIGLNTVTLLKACSKGLGISPSSAMNAAEHLYTSGYISYPRTETTAYSPNFDLVAALEEQANHPNWGRVAMDLLRSGKISRPKKGQDVGDHPPITPVKAASRNEITKPNEWRIYDYVTRHFIATLHNDMEYVEYKINADIGGHQFFFISHQVLDRGYTFAMPWKEKNLNLNEIQLPQLQQLKSLSFPVSGFNKEENYTKPPDYLQESELIALMDRYGIGTDASIPQHIKNIQDRHYVDVCGPGEDGKKGVIIPKMKFFGKNNRGKAPPNARPASRHMVPRGFGLAFLSAFELLDNELCEPRIRGYMEQQINKIATGETDKGDVVTTNLKLFLSKFLAFRDNLQRVDRYFAPKFDHHGINSVCENQLVTYQNQHGSYPNQRGGYKNQRGGFAGRGGYGGRGKGEFAVGNKEDRLGGDFGESNNNWDNVTNNRGGRSGNRGRANGNPNMNEGSYQENTFSPNDRGNHGNQLYERGCFKRQKTWE